MSSTPLTTPRTRRGPVPRQWTIDTVRDRCDVVDSCWLWRQYTTREGHPQATIHGKSTLVRRWVLEQMLGRPIAAGRVAGMRCADLACVSPHCLYERRLSDLVKQTYTSGKRGSATERHRRRQAAERMGMAKINAAAALSLRQQVAGLPRAERHAVVRAFAAQHGMTRKHASRVALGTACWQLPQTGAFSHWGGSHD